MRALHWKKALAPYVRRPLFESYGIHHEDRPVLVDCSLGVNPFGRHLSQKTVTFSAAEFSKYTADGPHASARLAQYVCSRWPDLVPEQISFGAGSLGILNDLARMFGGNSITLLGYLPQFLPGLIEFSLAGTNVKTLSFSPPTFNVTDSLALALEPETTTVYLDNPNNPTGQALPLEEVARFAEICAANGTVLICDEAYGDFLPDEESSLNLPQANIITLRSFSKGCGLAGLRLGYIVSRDPEFMAYYNKTALIYSSSALSAALAAEVLPDLDLPAMRERVMSLKHEVLMFIRSFAQCVALDSHPATPIFLLKHHFDEDLYDLLMDAGIKTEAGRFFCLDPSIVRMRIPSPEEFPLFTRLFSKALQKGKAKHTTHRAV